MAGEGGDYARRLASQHVYEDKVSVWMTMCLRVPNAQKAICG